MESIKNANHQIQQQGRHMKKKANSDNEDEPFEVADGNLRTSPANKLGEDELTMIFSFNSYWITTNDLLNFRLVNKNWRDAATTTLLRRDACKVAARAIPRNITKNEDDDNGDVALTEDQSSIDNHQDKKNTLGTLTELTELTELISNSSKFPASRFEIHTSLNYSKDYADYPDLIEFFKLHGEKIKTLCPHGYISRDLVLDICFTYAPGLECLDLSEIKLFSNDGGKEDSRALKWSSKILPFKTLILPGPWKSQNSTKSDVVNFLLSSTSKLLNLADVTPSMLDNVLKEWKSNLVKSFVFQGWEELYSVSFSSLLKSFCKLSPKLSSLTLDDFSDGLTPELADAINAMLRSSQISLQFLELSEHLGVNCGILKIPPLQNLKKLTLLGTLEDYDPEYLSPTVEDLPLSVEFQDGFAPGHKYFPNLLSFKLDLGYTSTIASPASYICRFPKKSFSKVDTLEICSVEWENLKNVELDYTMFSEFFQNVRVLKFSCGKIRNLSGTLWKMRSLEFIEIYDISKYHQTSPADVSLVPFVDQFFSGFSTDMCHKLQTEKLLNEMDNPVILKFLRMKPSIRDLQNVKELKLKFSEEFSGQFASRVTGEYVFGKMPDTKFIVSYDTDKISMSGDKGDKVGDEDQFGQSDSDEENDEREDFEEICFGPIKPYVQIIRGKKHC